MWLEHSPRGHGKSAGTSSGAEPTGTQPGLGMGWWATPPKARPCLRGPPRARLAQASADPRAPGSGPHRLTAEGLSDLGSSILCPVSRVPGPTHISEWTCLREQTNFEFSLQGRCWGQTWGGGPWAGGRRGSHQTSPPQPRSQPKSPKSKKYVKTSDKTSCPLGEVCKAHSRKGCLSGTGGALRIAQ